MTKHTNNIKTIVLDLVLVIGYLNLVIVCILHLGYW